MGPKRGERDHIRTTREGGVIPHFDGGNLKKSSSQLPKPAKYKS